jgi:pimeloyl-ACP methyl ester carboxylesterase
VSLVDRFLDYRPGNEPAHHPVLLLHGLGASHHYWAAVAPLLAADRRVVAVDLPGFGSSPRSEVFSLERASAQVANLVTDLGPGPCYLVGHSLGGIVALFAARELGSSILGVVLVDAHLFTILDVIRSPKKAFGHPRAAFSVAALISGTMLPGRAELTRATAMSSVMRRLLFWPVAYAPERLDGRLLREAFSASGSRGTLRAIAALRRVRDIDLMDVDHPFDVSIVWGRNDNLITKEDSARATRTLRCKAAEEIPECGHWPMLEHPTVLTAVIRKLCE